MTAYVFAQFSTRSAVTNGALKGKGGKYIKPINASTSVLSYRLCARQGRPMLNGGAAISSVPGYTLRWKVPSYLIPITLVTNTTNLINYFMRAWDTGNNQFVYWDTAVPKDKPVTTSPVMSNVNNLINIAVVHMLT